MKIELKNINYAEFASEETNCYSASLYVDGKRLGVVRNDGHGGPDYFDGNQADFNKVNDWCKANLPKWEAFGSSGITDLEMHCASLLSDWLLEKEYKRLSRGKILFIEGGDLMHVSFKRVRKITQDHLDWFTVKYPERKALNSMPFADGFAAFKGAV